MTKPNKTRWDVCEQCIGGSFSCELKARILSFIDCNRDMRWQNPQLRVYRLTSMNLNWEGLLEVCVGCKFAFEHAILSQELKHE